MPSPKIGMAFFGGSGGIRVIESRVSILTKGERQPRRGFVGCQPCTSIVQRPTQRKNPTLSAGFWRKRRDSNPRGLAPKRFSRPPRYDHFDTLPNIRLTLVSLNSITILFYSVNFINKILKENLINEIKHIV